MRLSSSRRSALPLVLLLLLSLSAARVGRADLTNDQNASKVIGAPDYTSMISPPSSMTLPSNTAFDASGNLWVADAGDNRVLEFRAPFSTGMNASLVIGQPGFTLGTSPTTQSTLFNPSGLTFDSSGNLWVTDTNDNRVLEFRAPFTSGMNAYLVLGQSDFTSSSNATTTQSSLNSPLDVVFDPGGNLWVSDGGSNRVLEYQPPFTSDMNASFVLGQSSMQASSAGATQTGLDYPTDASFDASGNLWVADGLNNRVLEFRAPFTSGMEASLVIGQANFTTSAASTTQDGLSSPGSVGFDGSGDLWLADALNNRVLEFRAPFTDGMNASLVLGQPGFTSSAAAVTQTGMTFPSEVSIDSAGDIWVADSLNNRVLEFRAPFSTGGQASLALGQQDFASNLLGGQARLSHPQGTAFDASGNLWVADMDDDRVIQFKSPLSNGEPASIVIGSSSFSQDQPGTASGSTFSPTDVAFDPSGDLWVADSGNNRVLEFRAPFSTGMNASLVIGQSNFTARAAGSGQGGLADPLGLTFDASGNLWVADTINNRVLEFRAPFSSGMAAAAVIGQPGFTSITSGVSQTQFHFPFSLAFDPAGNLFVADTGNSRVLEFRPSFTNGEAASVVIGQPGFTSSSRQTSQAALFLPYGIGFDSTGDLWVADSGNNRVVEFRPSLSTGMPASLVIGQPDYISRGMATTQSGLRIPVSVSTSPSGDIWVGDQYNNRILAFGSLGTTSASRSISSSSSSSSSSTSSTVPEFPPPALAFISLAVLAAVALLARVSASKNRRSD